MNETHNDIDIELPEHDCLYETTNENGFIDVEPAYRKSTVLRLIEADRKRIAELESANAELERLCDETYVAQGANAYNLACEEMEGWQAKRRKAGKEVGTTGSLCDGIQWLYGYIEELEAKRRGEPVKVPSDKDILTVWADTPKADSRSGDAIAFARAILAHYGQVAHQGGSNET